MSTKHLLLVYVLLQISTLSLQSLHMLAQGPQAFAAPFGPKYAQEWGCVCVHSLSALVVLMLGPPLLLRWKIGHRWLGRLYLLSAVVAGLSGIPLSVRAEGSPASFLILSLLWLRAAWGAYQTARARQWKEHRHWVQVHYLLAWSAVFLRLGLGVSEHLGVPLGQVTLPLAWLSWQPGFWLGWWRRLW